LMLGASGVWIGTRFIVSVESKAPASFKEECVAPPPPRDVSTLESEKADGGVGWLKRVTTRGLNRPSGPGGRCAR
jgi:NAD(P)H-dependent flavin oxidoreductase YrpB (nitropropane dioxygenase family)